MNSTETNAVQHLTTALQECPSLRQLDLGATGASDVGALAVADLLKSGKCPNLSVLDLRCNFIGQRGTKAIGAALGKSSLKKLRLENNLVLGAFADCLLNQRRGLEISLQNNFLN